MRVKPDFVVMSSGTAVPMSQSKMREAFEAVGFPSRTAGKTAEAGVIHTVSTRSGTIDISEEAEVVYQRVRIALQISFWNWILN